MDMFEQIAQDLEHAQNTRYKKSRGNKRKGFFDNQVELDIFEFTKDLRKKSRTYDPSNER